jgi:hypothetical protein
VKTRFLVALMFVGLMTVGSSSAQNLINNAGFETGDFTSWTLTGNTVDGTVANDNTFVADCGYSNTCSQSGNFQALFGAVGSPGGVSQTVATTPGGTYEVSFWLQGDGGTPSSISISFGGVTLISQANQPGFDYTFYSFLVNVTGPTSTFAISVRDDPVYYSLDDVAVVQTPEPASLALLGSAMTLGAGYVRKVRS